MLCERCERELLSEEAQAWKTLCQIIVMLFIITILCMK
jgi:hypothetical protein